LLKKRVSIVVLNSSAEECDPVMRNDVGSGSRRISMNLLCENQCDACNVCVCVCVCVCACVCVCVCANDRENVLAVDVVVNVAIVVVTDRRRLERVGVLAMYMNPHLFHSGPGEQATAPYLAPVGL
jgi:hypothetical protein